LPKMSFASRDGLTLEGRITLPPDKHGGGVVLCHPHPTFGGTMDVWLLPQIQRALAAEGWSVLRFNFRGVEGSEGEHSGGGPEVADLLGALDHLASAEGVTGPFAVVGWSFGAVVGLFSCMQDPRLTGYVAMGFPLMVPPGMIPPLPVDLGSWSAAKLFVVGEYDAWCPTDSLEDWLAGVGDPKEVAVVKGTDHFFFDQDREVAALVTSFLARTTV